MKTKERNYFENLIEEVKNGKGYDNLGMFKTCYNFPDHVVLKQYKCSFRPSSQQMRLEMLNDLGLKTPRMVYYTEFDYDTQKNHKLIDPFFEVQEKAKGKQLYLSSSADLKKMMSTSEKPSQQFSHNLDTNYCQKYNLKNYFKVLTAPDSHLEKYLKAFIIGTKLNLLYDCHSANLFYDGKEGFSFIDLPKIEYFTKGMLENIPFSAYEVLDDALYGLCLGSDTPGYKYFNNLMMHRIQNIVNNSDLGFNETHFKTIHNFFNNAFNQDNYFRFRASDNEHKYFLQQITSKNSLEDIIENLSSKIKDFDLTNLDLDKEIYFKSLKSVTINNATAYDYLMENEFSNSTNLHLETIYHDLVKNDDTEKDFNQE